MIGGFYERVEGTGPFQGRHWTTSATRIANQLYFAENRAKRSEPGHSPGTAMSTDVSGKNTRSSVSSASVLQTI